MKILLDKGQNCSFANKLNFVCKKENIYTMDNHLAAIWCMCQLDCRKRYNLLHIDRHYDLNKVDDKIHEDIKNKNIRKIKIDKLDKQKKAYEKIDYPLFTWNNYINVFNKKHPKTINKAYFITKGVGELNYEKDYEIISFKDKSKLKLQEGNWIINIDLDYFFDEKADETNSRSHSDEQIRKFAKWLNNVKDRAALVILCLSPECCGKNDNTWDESLKVLSLIENEIYNDPTTIVSQHLKFEQCNSV